MARSSTKNIGQLANLPHEFTTRDELTVLLFGYLESEYLTIDQFKSQIFFGTSWRLSRFGYGFIQKLFRPYEIDCQDHPKLNGRVLINLDKIVNGPWFANDRIFVVWAPEIYFELSMFDGNLHEYVDFYRPKNIA